MNPRSNPTVRSVIPSALRPHPHAHITSILHRRAYSKHGEEPFFKITSADSQLKIPTLSRDKRARLLTVLQCSIKFTRLPQLIRDESVFCGRRKASKAGSRLPRNDPSTFKRATTPHPIKITCKTRSTASEWLVSTTKQDTRD